MQRLALNLGLFKAGWIAAVFTAAAKMPLAGTLVVGIVAAIHVYRAEDRAGEVRLLVLAAAIGFVWESLLVSTGLVRYDAGSAAPGLAPYWIVAMWVLFATTLNVGMRWLRRSVWLATAMGAIGGPLSFLAGEKMGAVSFPNVPAALAAIGLGWAVLLPLLVRYAARQDSPREMPALAESGGKS